MTEKKSRQLRKPFVRQAAFREDGSLTDIPARNSEKPQLEKQFKERNLTQEQFKAALDALIGEPEKDNLFGISQAVSAAAQRFQGEQSYELQRAAVQISGQR